MFVVLRSRFLIRYATECQKPKNLTNHLIASPNIDGGIFLYQSLVYICRQDNKGTLGLVINKPIEPATLPNLFEELNIDVTITDFGNFENCPLDGVP